MPKISKKIKTAEQIVMKNYLDERSKVSEAICKEATKQSFHNNIFISLSGGATLGIIIGLLCANTVAQVPVHDSCGKIIEYKTDYKLVSKYMILSIATAMLAMLAFAGIKTNIDRKLNRVWCKRLANDFLTESFKTPLENLQTIADNRESLSHTVQAAAMIITNMPEDQLLQIRELAIKTYGNLSDDEYFNGFLSPDNKYVNRTATLISNYIHKNPELQFNILKIMNGNEPTTYFLNSIQQKTK